MKCRAQSQRISNGFTLVELVVVVLILAILAAVAAPRLFDTTGDARNASTRQSLSVIRNAIEMHRARLGVLPGDLGTEEDLKADLAPFLQGAFPEATGNNNAAVRIQNNGSILSASGNQGWAYDMTTGQFIVNHADGSDW